MKRLSVLVIALVVACAPAQSGTDPNTKNAAFAAALCAQDIEAVWNATDAGLQAELTQMAEYYGLADGQAIVAESIAFPDGTKCDEAKFAAAYTDKEGNAVSVYVLTFTDAAGSWGLFYVFGSTESGVSSVN